MLLIRYIMLSTVEFANNNCIHNSTSSKNVLMLIDVFIDFF